MGEQRLRQEVLNNYFYGIRLRLLECFCNSNVYFARRTRIITDVQKRRKL